MRRLMILTALLAGATIVAAQQPATFIMNNGERMNGTVLARDAQSFSSRGAGFLVRVNGRTLQLSRNDVAVIDFVGGRPSVRELASLPYDGNQLLVLQDGGLREGRFVNFVGSDRVRWSYEPGDTETIPIWNIRRIYLNTGGAERAFGYSRSPQSWPRGYGSDRGAGGSGAAPYGRGQGGVNGQGGGYGQGGSSGQGGRDRGPGNGVFSGSQAMDVPANVAWTDTGIDVNAGDTLTFTATGQVTFIRGAGSGTTAAGDAAMKSNSYPVPRMPVGALIGQVGASSPFFIGASTDPVRMPANGRLKLGVNDDAFGDNSGAFHVVIRSAR
jgi:hypothetical protein